MVIVTQKNKSCNNFTGFVFIYCFDVLSSFSPFELGASLLLLFVLFSIVSGVFVLFVLPGVFVLFVLPGVFVLSLPDVLVFEVFSFEVLSFSGSAGF